MTFPSYITGLVGGTCSVLKSARWHIYIQKEKGKRSSTIHKISDYSFFMNHSSIFQLCNIRSAGDASRSLTQRSDRRKQSYICMFSGSFEIFYSVLLLLETGKSLSMNTEWDTDTVMDSDGWIRILSKINAYLSVVYAPCRPFLSLGQSSPLEMERNWCIIFLI